MAKFQRFACILLPMILTLASIIVTLSIFIPSTWKNLQRNSQFMKLDTRYVLDPDALDKIPSDNKGYKKAGIDKTNAQNVGLKDFYSVNIMNYCEGTFSVKGDDEHGVWSIDHCHGAKTGFTFQPVDLLESSKDLDGKIPKKIADAQKYMDKLWRFMVGAYIVGFAANVFTFIVGWFGLLSRWGSFATTLFATVAAIGTFLSAVLATVLFNSLKLAFNKTKDTFGITATVYVRPMYYTWAAWVFASAAFIFWLASACCCSGRTKRVMGSDTEKRNSTASTASASPFASLASKVGISKQAGYQPVGTPQPPAYGQSGHNMDTFNSYNNYPQSNTAYGHQTVGSYEPYQHK